MRRDRHLPDLALLLDPVRLADRVKTTLGRSDIARAEVTYLRYKPSQSCLAACRIEVDGRQIDVVAKAYRPSAAGKLLKAMTRPAVPGPLGPGRFLLDNSTAVVSVFPNDLRMPRLAQLMSPDSIQQLIARIADEQRRAADGRATDMTPYVHHGHEGATGRLETLRHNPERRFVGKLVVDEKAIATVRCYARRDCEAMFAKAGAVKNRSPLRVALLLTHWRRRCVLAFEWLNGELLERAIRQRFAPPSGLELVGAALARLHDQDGRRLSRRSEASDAAAIVSLSHDLAFLHPPIARPVRKLARRVSAGLATKTDGLCTLHGDFYAKQVLLNGPAAEFIDLDEAALGNPAIDLARFRADLEVCVLAGHLEPGEVESLIDRMHEGYRIAGRTLPSDLNLHIAAQLLRVAGHPFRRRDPSWPTTLEAILDRAAAFLDKGASAKRGLTPASRGSDPNPPVKMRGADPNVMSDPLMPFLGVALNPAEIASTFARNLDCLNAARKTRVVRIAVGRHKPGRRCLIAYDLSVLDVKGSVQDLAVVGKVRARGADTGTHDLQCALWAGRFGPSATDGIFVPEPLGVVKALHMTVQRRVPGTPATGLLEGPSGVGLARRVAESIHKLHDTPAPGWRRHTVEDELRILRERLASVIDEHPLWQTRVERVLDGCVRLAARVQDDSWCGIHRDFYPDQVLVDGERLYLTDFDLYARGPAALDIGNFVAHVQEYSLRRFGNPEHLIDRTEMLIERYLQLSSNTTRKSIYVWATLSLVRHVAISWSLAERRPFTPDLIELCEWRILERSTQ